MRLCLHVSPLAGLPLESACQSWLWALVTSHARARTRCTRMAGARAGSGSTDGRARCESPTAGAALAHGEAWRSFRFVRGGHPFKGALAPKSNPARRTILGCVMQHNAGSARACPPARTAYAFTDGVS